MAGVGQVITNPLTGERITFLKTSEETGGTLLVFDCRVRPGGVRLPAHVHRTYEERFEIVSGTLGVMLGRERYFLFAGQRLVLPAGIAHQWWVAGATAAHFRVTVVPPRQLEMVLEVVCGMAQRGKLTRRCWPKNPFELAHLGLLSESYLPWVPVVLQQATLTVLAACGRLAGYGPDFAAYRSPVTYPSATAIDPAIVA
jgi:mannose-6-phosphate isomerase-like protein (cupin superfamily)